jgi:TRAP-type C4-dicarboxylate transport system permease large subunit
MAPSFQDWSVAQQASVGSLFFLVLGVVLFLSAVVMVVWYLSKRKKKVEEVVKNETNNEVKR